MMTTTKTNPSDEAPVLEDPTLEDLMDEEDLPAAMRSRVLAAFSGREHDEKYRPKFVGILKCQSLGTEELDDVMHTAVKLKQSSYEPDAKVKLGIKIPSEILTKWFKAGGHYVIQLREAPTAPDGTTTNLKLEGEIASILISSVHIGRTVRQVREESIESAVLNFTVYGGEDGGATKCALELKSDMLFLLDRFELGNVYRLAVLPAPKWLDRLDKEHRAKMAADKRMRAEERAAKKNPNAGAQPLPFPKTDAAAAEAIAWDFARTLGRTTIEGIEVTFDKDGTPCVSLGGDAQVKAIANLSDNLGIDASNPDALVEAVNEKLAGTGVEATYDYPPDLLKTESGDLLVEGVTDAEYEALGEFFSDTRNDGDRDIYTIPDDKVYEVQKVLAKVGARMEHLTIPAHMDSGIVYSPKAGQLVHIPFAENDADA